MTNKKIAVIPAYEPTETLAAIAEGLDRAGYIVVVVDDGSGPDYGGIFDSVRPFAAVISYVPNRGKGHALKTGFRYISERFDGDCVIVTLDSDGQHTVADAEKVAAAALCDPGALTLGVRTFGKETPVRSMFGNTVTRAVYHLSTGQRVSDTQTGLRAFGAELLPVFLGVEGQRYEYEMNVLMECPRMEIPMREVPISTIYMNSNKGSHFHTFRDSAIIYGNIIKFAASSLTGFVIDYGLFSLLTVLLGGFGTAISVPVSNVTARIVSAGTNFAINKRFVFRNKDSVAKTGAQYFALAACILAGNTLLISFLVNGLGVNRFAAKLVTEVTFFSISFIAQRFWIFRKKKSGGRSAAGPRPAAISNRTGGVL